MADLYEQLEGQPRLAMAKSARHLSCAALFYCVGFVLKLATLYDSVQVFSFHAHLMTCICM